MQRYLIMGGIGLLTSVLIIFLSDKLPLIAKSDEEIDLLTRPERRLLSFRNTSVMVLTLIIALYLAFYESLTVIAGVHFFFCASFILIGVIDFEHYLVLDVLMIPLFIIALLELFLNGRVTPLYGLSGFAIAQIFVMGIYLFGKVFLWLVNSGRPEEERVTEIPFGFGDVTLAAYCGLVVGLPYAVVMLFLMILIGGGMALLFLIAGRFFTRKYRVYRAIPYGPAIVIAAAVMLIWGDKVMNALGIIY